MNTQIHIKEDGKQIMELYTYTDSKGINEIRRQNLLPLVFTELYDSPEEVKVQSSGLAQSKLTFLTVYVNMSGTVFDKLDSLDLARLSKFYDEYQSQIAAYHKSPNNTAKLSLEMCAIYYLKNSGKSGNIGIIRGVKRRRSNTQYSGLSCINTPTILMYTIIDAKVILNCKVT